MTAIYDTMQYVRPDMQTFVIGQAASAAAVLLGAGAPGKRFALPNARILIHQPALAGGDYGQASDIEIQANEVLRMRTWLEETLAKHTGRTIEQVENDIERDKILSAESAKEYGLIDEVLAEPQGLARLLNGPRPRLARPGARAAADVTACPRRLVRSWRNTRDAAPTPAFNEGCAGRPAVPSRDRHGARGPRRERRSGSRTPRWR